MKYGIFSLELQKVIAQIRFRPTMKSYRESSVIAEKVEAKFTEWSAAKNDSITLYSPEEKISFSVLSDNLTFTHEDITHTSTGIDGVELIKEAFNTNTEDFGIEQIRRVGFRTINFFGCSDCRYDDLVQMLYSKFYSNRDILQSISAEVQRDVVFILEGSKDGLLNRVQIGPVRKSELRQPFDNNFPVDDSKLSDMGIFLDVDVFAKDALTRASSISTLEDAQDACNRIVAEYMEFLTS